MVRTFFTGFGWSLLIVGAFLGWFAWLTSIIMDCGDGKVPIAHWGHGVYCVQGERWKP